jgi:hypothetical protein
MRRRPSGLVARGRAQLNSGLCPKELVCVPRLNPDPLGSAAWPGRIQGFQTADPRGCPNPVITQYGMLSRGQKVGRRGGGWEVMHGGISKADHTRAAR